jgi:hypothetical protein
MKKMPVETKKTPESLNLDPGKADYRQMCKYGKGSILQNPISAETFFG